jgi:hypothetical protein
MRVSTAAICTLATFLSGEVGHLAIASSLSPLLQDQPAEEDTEATDMTEIAPVSSTNSVTAPEQLLERKTEAISAINSETSTRSLSDHALQKLRPVATAPEMPVIAPPEFIPSPERSLTIPSNPDSEAASDSSKVAALSVQTVTEPGNGPARVELQDTNESETMAIARVSRAADEVAPTPVLTDANALIAQTSDVPSAEEAEDVQLQLRNLEPDPQFGDVFEGSPAITISNPSGYGADNFEGFVNFNYQTETRLTNEDDGSLGVGIGFGDAREAVGFQLSYTLASFGGSRDFGTGGFNAKLHRQFSDSWSAALGWEGFLTVGDDSDFEDSIYGTVTHIIRTRPDIDDLFSRIALTAGAGNGRFRSEDDILDDDDTLGVFGSVAFRVARPVSAIVEWTGQDLAMGLSIVPIRNVPWVITPAVRDIAGAGDGARFVIGTGISFQF